MSSIFRSSHPAVSPRTHRLPVVDRASPDYDTRRTESRPRRRDDPEMNQQEEKMKFLWGLLVAPLASVALSAQRGGPAPFADVPVIPATITDIPFAFPNDDLAMGEVPGIALKKNGHIFTYS